MSDDTSTDDEPTQEERIAALRADYRERRYPTLNPMESTTHE